MQSSLHIVDLKVEQIVLVSVNRQPARYHRCIEVDASAGGITDGPSATAVAAAVGKASAYLVAPARALLTVGAVVGIAPVIRSLAERVVTSVRHDRHVQQSVNAVLKGVSRNHAQATLDPDYGREFLHLAYATTGHGVQDKTAIDRHRQMGPRL